MRARCWVTAGKLYATAGREVRCTAVCCSSSTASGYCYIVHSRVQDCECGGCFAEVGFGMLVFYKLAWLVCVGKIVARLRRAELPMLRPSVEAIGNQVPAKEEDAVNASKDAPLSGKTSPGPSPGQKVLIVDASALGGNLPALTDNKGGGGNSEGSASVRRIDRHGNLLCPHNRIKRQCKECGGSAFCEHGRIKYTCKECKGTGICEHGRIKRQCKDCGGGSICEHSRRKDQCKDCGGNGLCTHGRIKRQCKLCGGLGLCEHGRQKGQCKVCGGSGICGHGRSKYTCKQCRAATEGVAAPTAAVFLAAQLAPVLPAGSAAVAANHQTEGPPPAKRRRLSKSAAAQAGRLGAPPGAGSGAGLQLGAQEDEDLDLNTQPAPQSPR